MSTVSQTSNNVPYSANVLIPCRRKVLEARAEIVEEHVEANGVPAPSQEPQENTHFTSDESKDRKRKSWWKRIFHRRRKPKTTQNHFPPHHGHKTDLLRMSVDVLRVLGESVTGGSTEPHADSGRPTEKES